MVEFDRANENSLVGDELRLVDNLYYRDRIFPEMLAALNDSLSGERPFRELPLDAYQAWNEAGWKKPHLSYEAADRFSAKAVEEAREVGKALEHYWASQKPEQLIDELGDYLWVATAFANNGGVAISDAIKGRLEAYAAGTKVQNDQLQLVSPVWHDVAAELSVKQEALTLGDIEVLLAEGFVPDNSAYMNHYEPQQISGPEIAFDFMWYAPLMTSLANRQYSYGESKPTIQTINDFSGDLGAVVAEVYLRTAAMAHLAGKTITDVVQRNIEKITHRIETGTVDRADGIRATETN